VIVLAQSISDDMLDTLGRGANGGAIELLSANGSVIATLKLSNPATQAAAGGELEFNAISEGTSTMNATATYARIVDVDGREILSCDVGGLESDAVVKLVPNNIQRGQPVRLDSFKLQMP
jgi:hypothetical protein